MVAGPPIAAGDAWPGSMRTFAAPRPGGSKSAGERDEPADPTI